MLSLLPSVYEFADVKYILVVLAAAGVMGIFVSVVLTFRLHNDCRGAVPLKLWLFGLLQCIGRRLAAGPESQAV